VSTAGVRAIFTKPPTPQAPGWPCELCLIGLRIQYYPTWTVVNPGKISQGSTGIVISRRFWIQTHSGKRSLTVFLPSSPYSWSADPEICLPIGAISGDFQLRFKSERVLQKRVESKHSFKERDHLIVRIFGRSIGGKGPVDDHEPMGFPLVYFELKVLAGCIELLCIVIYAIDRAWLVA
jgi:hypothetical protein